MVRAASTTRVLLCLLLLRHPSIDLCKSTKRNLVPKRHWAVYKGSHQCDYGLVALILWPWRMIIAKKPRQWPWREAKASRARSIMVCTSMLLFIRFRLVQSRSTFSSCFVQKMENSWFVVTGVAITKWLCAVEALKYRRGHLRSFSLAAASSQDFHMLGDVLWESRYAQLSLEEKRCNA